MTIGQLKSRVTLRAIVADAGRVGAAKPTYIDVGNVAAAVRGYRDFEIARFRQQQARCDREVTIRKRADVSSGWQIVIAGITHEIEGVENDELWTTIRAFKVGP